MGVKGFGSDYNSWPDYDSWPDLNRKKNRKGVSCLGSSSHLNPNPNPNPNPDPTRWETLGVWQFPNAYVIQARYLDCTNYEGVKVMVFRGQYVKRTRLDPHFSEDTLSPVARFKPTAWGLEEACNLAERL